MRPSDRFSDKNIRSLVGYAFDVQLVALLILNRLPGNLAEQPAANGCRVQLFFVLTGFDLLGLRVGLSNAKIKGCQSLANSCLSQRFSIQVVRGPGFSVPIL